MGYAEVRSSSGSIRNTVNNDLNRYTTGDGVTVVGDVDYFLGVRRREGILWGRIQEGCMVVSRGGEYTS